MNEKETQATPSYEAPRLDVVTLRADEVLAGSCKDAEQISNGPTLFCVDEFGSTCATLGS